MGKNRLVQHLTEKKQYCNIIAINWTNAEIQKVSIERLFSTFGIEYKYAICKWSENILTYSMLDGSKRLTNSFGHQAEHYM